MDFIGELMIASASRFSRKETSFLWMVDIVVSPATMRRSFCGLAALLVVVASAIYMRAQIAAPAAGVPGAQSDGSTLLANGWRIAPAGRTLKTGTLPLNVIVSPDGRY